MFNTFKQIVQSIPNKSIFHLSSTSSKRSSTTHKCSSTGLTSFNKFKQIVLTVIVVEDHLNVVEDHLDVVEDHLDEVEEHLDALPQD